MGIKMRKLAVIFSLLVFLTPAIYGENSTVENRLIPIPNESSFAGAFAKFKTESLAELFVDFLNKALEKNISLALDDYEKKIVRKNN